MIDLPLLSRALLVATIVACTAAGEGPVATEEPALTDLLTYVPDGAHAVFVADPPAIARSQFFVEIDPMLDLLRFHHLDDVTRAAGACGVGVETWSAFVFASNALTTGEWVVVVRAKHIGEKKTLDCVAEYLRAHRAGEWYVTEKQGRVVFDNDLDAGGIAVGDDVVLVREKEYANEVAAVLDGTGKSAADGQVGRRLTGVDGTKSVRFAIGPLPGVVDATLPGMEHVTGTLDVSSGLAADVSFTFTDRDKAEANAKQLATVLETAKGFLPGMGIPAVSLETLELDENGTTLSVRGSMTDDELRTTAIALVR